MYVQGKGYTPENWSIGKFKKRVFTAQAHDIGKGLTGGFKLPKHILNENMYIDSIIDVHLDTENLLNHLYCNKTDLSFCYMPPKSASEPKEYEEKLKEAYFLTETMAALSSFYFMQMEEKIEKTKKHSEIIEIVETMPPLTREWPQDKVMEDIDRIIEKQKNTDFILVNMSL